MARDLVTKLKHADEDPDQIFSDPELYRVCSDAADEIERLRTLVAFHEEQNRQANAMREAALSLAFPNGLPSNI